MEPFTYIPKNETSERAIFANQACQLLFDKHLGDLEKVIADIKPVYDNFQTFVRNIYELIDREIPLFALYELRELGAGNCSLDETQYNAAISRTTTACAEYYGQEYKNPINTVPDKDGNIDVPDELMPLFNSLGTRLRMHTISGRSEILTIAAMVNDSHKFFTDKTIRLKPSNS